METASMAQLTSHCTNTIYRWQFKRHQTPAVSRSLDRLPVSTSVSKSLKELARWYLPSV
ncbi:mCG114504 [Mus musculus]|nr:mCG114504 [Mus musculus]